MSGDGCLSNSFLATQNYSCSLLSSFVSVDKPKGFVSLLIFLSKSRKKIKSRSRADIYFSAHSGRCEELWLESSSQCFSDIGSSGKCGM